MTTPEQIQSLRIDTQKAAIDAGTWTTCLNCEAWSSEKCNKFNGFPPLEVQVVGCQAWERALPF